jgi:serine/threonine-protein kinase
VVHRDLKLNNLMILRDEDAVGGERIKLVDFGIAKMFTDEEQGTQTSVGEQQPGTPAYMAPEQISGTLDTDADPAKMDVYAMGVILYQTLSGRLPIWSPNPMGLMAMVLSHEPESLLKLDPSIPPDLAKLTHEMLAKDPKLRPTMEQVRDRLRSRPEAVVLRPTAEIDAIAPLSWSEGSSGAQTADAPGQPSLPQTAPPLLPARGKSVGDRSTQPQPPEAMEAHSSVGRGTGQQVTGAETRARRNRQKLGLGLAAAGLVLAVSGVATWQMIKPAPKSKPAASTPAPPPAAPSQPPPVGVAPAPATTGPLPTPEPQETPAKKATKKPPASIAAKEPSCAPTVDCISGELSTSDKLTILDALNQAGVSCSSSLTLVARPKPAVTAAKAVKPAKRYQIEMALQGAGSPINFRGEVQVKCAKR